MNWSVVISIAGMAITLGIFSYTQWKRDARREGVQSAHSRSVDKKIADLDKTDSTLCSSIEKALTWGRDTVEQRIVYNDNTFVRKDTFELRMKNIEEKVDRINVLDLESRLTRMEECQKHMSEQQKEVLTLLKEIKNGK